MSNIDVVILAGGQGTRIRGILGNTPKILAPVNGTAFLDILLGRLRQFGVKRFVLCLGHLADRVRKHIGGEMDVELSIEPEPLGTGGALRFARQKIRSDPVLVMNGDTWLDADFCQFVERHRQSRASISMLCVPVSDSSRFDVVQIDKNGVLTFPSRKKGRTGIGASLVSAGTYLLSGSALDALGATAGASLEHDLLRRGVLGPIFGFVPEETSFIDIGTPESLRNAGRWIGRAYQP